MAAGSVAWWTGSSRNVSKYRLNRAKKRVQVHTHARSMNTYTSYYYDRISSFRGCLQGSCWVLVFFSYRYKRIRDLRIRVRKKIKKKIEPYKSKRVEIRRKRILEKKRNRNVHAHTVVYKYLSIHVCIPYGVHPAIELVVFDETIENNWYNGSSSVLIYYTYMALYTIHNANEWEKPRLDEMCNARVHFARGPHE